MNKERLIELKKVLKDIPEQKFGMDNWIYLDHSCGTVACALGWAARHPQFKEQGLKLNHSGGSLYPVFGEWIGYDAAEFFFDIPGTIVHWVFDPEEYERHLYHDEKGDRKVTPADVIARIDLVLAYTYQDKTPKEKSHA